MPTLLEKAKDVRVSRGGRGVPSDEMLELALAVAKGEIQARQACQACLASGMKARNHTQLLYRALIELIARNAHKITVNGK